MTLTPADLRAFEQDIADVFNTGAIKAPVQHGVIYLLTNQRNGKRYVGQTTAKVPQKRINDHFKDAENGHNSLIAQAIRKYGKEGFSTEIIWTCYDQGSLNASEDSFIELFCTISPEGYNLKQGGSRGKHSLELRERMSQIRRRPEVVERMRRGAAIAMAKPEVQERHRAALTELWSKPEMRLGQSLRAFAQHADPIKKERHRASLITANAKPEVKLRRSEAARAAHARLDVKERHREANRAGQNRPEVKAATRARLIGTNYANNGIENVRLKQGEELPEGFSYGMVKRS